MDVNRQEMSVALSIVLYGLVLLACPQHLLASGDNADYGDAPDPYRATFGSYPSLLESKGARHLNHNFARLGSRATTESDSNQTDADRYDDGVRFRNPLFACVPARVDIFIDTSGVMGAFDPTDVNKLLYLNGWFDWNANGVWSEDEHIIHWGGTPDRQTEEIAGEDVLTSATFVASNPWPGHPNGRILIFEIIPPVGAKIGQSYARFRLDYAEDAGNNPQSATDPSLWNVEGLAQFGEVEDYPLLDPRQDLVFHDTADSALAPRFVDMRFASARVEGIASDARLVMTMQLEKKFPDPPPSDAFISHHFVISLDGNSATGLQPSEQVVDLDVDLWIDTGVDPEFGPFELVRVFDSASGEFVDFLDRDLPWLVVNKSPKQLKMEISLNFVQFLAEEFGGVTINPEAMEWVAVTNFFEGDEPLGGPISDFIPNERHLLFQQGGERCEKPEKWAVVIGVEDNLRILNGHPVSNWSPGQEGIFDAEDFAELLKKRPEFGFGPEEKDINPENAKEGTHMITLLGKVGNGTPNPPVEPDVKSERILAALKWLEDKAKPQDIVVFYFSGHGNPDGTKPEDAHLFSSDGTLTAEQLGEGLDKIKATRKLIILDFSKAQLFQQALTTDKPKDRIILFATNRKTIISSEDIVTFDKELVKKLTANTLGRNKVFLHDDTLTAHEDHRHHPFTAGLLVAWTDENAIKKIKGKDNIVSVNEAFNAARLITLVAAKDEPVIYPRILKKGRDLALCGEVPIDDE